MSHVHEVQRRGPAVVTHHTPGSLDDALALLAAQPGVARPIAGGTDLLLELRRGARPDVRVLVDLTRIPGLDRIESDAEVLHLGPLVTHNQVVASPLVRESALPLAQACLEIGAAQLRNRATVAGNLVTASPANDTISALVALDAVVTLASVRGRREVAVADLYPGFRSTVLEPDELVVDIAVPVLSGSRRGVWVKNGLRRAQAISVVHVGVVVETDEAGVLTDARVALGSVAATVVRSAAAEQALIGGPLDAGRIAAAAAASAASVVPIDDVRGTGEYRSAVLEVMVRRALEVVAAGQEAACWPETPVFLWGRGGEGRAPTGADHAASHDDATPVDTVVNGTPVSVANGAGKTLLDWLREDVHPVVGGLTGTKEGCAEGECGACTVYLDGVAVMSCLVPAARAQGAHLTTIEGLDHRIQDTFVEAAAVQCGYCIPGFLMSGAKLLEECPAPSDAQVVQGLAGNLCRCTGYYKIIDAVHRAAGTAGEVRDR